MLVGTVASLAAVISHLHKVIRRSRSRALRALVIGSLTSCLSAAIRLPAVQPLLTVSGVNLTWPATDMLGFICMFWMLCYLCWTVAEDGANEQIVRQLRMLVVALAVLMLLFAAAPHSREFNMQRTGQYYGGGSSDSAVANIAWIVLAIYLLFPLWSLFHLATRWARKAAAIRWLSMTLRVYSAGMVLTGVVQFHVIAYQIILLIPRSTPPPWTEGAVESWPLTGANLCTMIGLIATGVYSWLSSSPRLGLLRAMFGRGRRWRQYYRAHRRLYPLWRTLWEVRPADEALHPSRSRLADMLRVRNVHRHLYRRTIELADFQRGLRQITPVGIYQRAQELGHAAGLDGEALRAVAGAACLAVGRLVATRGGASLRAAEPAHTHGSSVADDVDIAADVRWWLDVATAYARSPVVATVVAEAEQTIGPAPASLINTTQEVSK